MNPPRITTARHPMVRQLTTEPKRTTLNMALNKIVSNLWGVGGCVCHLGRAFEGKVVKARVGIV